MKDTFIYTILFLTLFISTSYCQNKKTEIEKRLSNIFLGFDTTVKPEKIEEENTLPWDGTAEKEPKKNGIIFKKHPYISNFYEGNYNVVYLSAKENFDDYGLYKIIMTTLFTDKNNCIIEYNKLIKYFELFGEKKIEVTTRNAFDLDLIDNKSTIFTENSFHEFPRLEIRYSEESDNISYLTITFMKSWNNSSTSSIQFFNN